MVEPYEVVVPYSTVLFASSFVDQDIVAEFDEILPLEMDDVVGAVLSMFIVILNQFFRVIPVKTYNDMLYDPSFNVEVFNIPKVLLSTDDVLFSMLDQFVPSDV